MDKNQSIQFFRYRQEFLIEPGVGNYMKMQFIQFRETHDIINPEFTTKNLVVDIDQNVKNKGSDLDGVQIIFKINQGSINQFTKQPQQLLQALQKVGGLLAIFNIGWLFSFIHRLVSERKLKKEFEEDENYRDQFSFRRIKSMQESIQQQAAFIKPIWLEY